jgi:hypothetical protein
MLRDDAGAVAGDAAADGGAEIEQLDAGGVFGGDARIGVEAEPAGFVVDEEVEEGMAVEVLHDFGAEGVDDCLRLV